MLGADVPTFVPLGIPPKFLRPCTLKVMSQLPDASCRAVARPVAAPAPITLAAAVA